MKRGLLTLLFVLILPAAASADELSSIIDRYVAWRGGGAYERLQTVEAAGTMEMSGLTGTITYRLGRDGRSRSEADFKVVKSLTVVTPDGGFSTNQSGQIESVSLTEAEAARRTRLFEFGEAVRGGGGVGVSLLPDEARDGQAWDVVRLTWAPDETWDLFIDPKTGALHGARIRENRRGRFETYEDWRRVDGVRFAFRTRTEAEIASDNAVIRLDRVTINQTFADDLFARPEAVRKATFAPGTRSTGWIDFEFFGSNRIYFPATVNGVAVKVLLDSGAESTVLNKGFADRLGLKSEGEVTAVGTGGTSTAGLVGGVDIGVAGLTLNDLTVATIDLSGVEKAIGLEIPVILGKEVFNQLIVDIDFEHHRIAFIDPDDYSPPAGATQARIELVDGLRATPVSIEGREPVLFDFDIGNGSPLIVFPTYAASQGLLENRPQSTGIAGAIGGRREVKVAAIETLAFGGVTFTRVPTTFPPEGGSAVDTTRTSGNLGLPILSRFRLVTDYPKDRLYLVPYPDAGRPFAFDRLGLSLRLDGDALVVDHVAPGGPSESAGFKAGDRIAAIDGRAATTWTREALGKLRTEAPATLAVTMADGSIRTVRTRTFY